MVSTFPAHDKLDPRIANPPKTPSCQDLKIRKEMLVLGGVGRGNEKRGTGGCFCIAGKPEAESRPGPAIIYQNTKTNNQASMGPVFDSRSMQTFCTFVPLLLVPKSW